MANAIVVKLTSSDQFTAITPDLSSLRDKNNQPNQRIKIKEQDFWYAKISSIVNLITRKDRPCTLTSISSLFKQAQAAYERLKSDMSAKVTIIDAPADTFTETSYIASSRFPLLARLAALDATDETNGSSSSATAHHYLESLGGDGASAASASQPQQQAQGRRVRRGSAS